MCKTWLLCVLLGTLAWGQAAPSTKPQGMPASSGNRMSAQKPATDKDSAESVPENAAVLTIDGVCETPAKSAVAKTTANKPGSASSAGAKSCRTVFTRAQFEELANNLAPNITPQMKKQLAGILPRLMAMASEAEKQGLENTPQYKELLKYARMQILAKQLQQKLQDEAAKISDADVEKYYKDHAENFEQYSLERLFVPRMKQIEPEAKEEAKAGEQSEKDKDAAEKAKQEEGEQAMTKLADDLRARAAAGEDFLKLQKEAFAAAGMKIESPTVTLPGVRRSGIPPAQAAVFDLKTGEVSQVLSDTGGHYIYKMTSKSEMPLEQAKSEIHTRLQNERMKEEMDKVNDSFKVETNEAYFGSGGSNPLAPRPMRPGPGAPPSGPSGAVQNPPSTQNQAKPE